MKLSRCVPWLVVGMGCSVVWGEVKLASVFTDHMVVQRSKPVVVWGTATAGRKVTVKFGDHQAEATATGDAKWVVRLGEEKASESPVEMVVSEEGGNTVTLQDVLVGDVWVCSGQSNMGFQLFQVGKGAEAEATDDKLRLLRVPRAVSEEPLEQQDGKWVVCSPKKAWDFSAVGYYFGREIRAREHVPVGMIGAYWGGTAAESWTPKSKLAGPEWTSVWEKDRQMLADYPKRLAAWEAKVKELDDTAKKPDKPLGAESPHRPSVLWNGMVRPVVPMSIAGVIWYQGESNAPRAEQYRALFPTLIEGWREAFGQGDVPFLFVQLANFRSGLDTDAGSPWAELREAQAMALRLPKTGMAVTIDVGDPEKIHPTDKQTVGRRLALVAEHVAYGKALVYEGPTYKAMVAEGNKVRVTFEHADGLMAKGGNVKGFTVAGEDKKFVPAEAAIEGNAVVATLPDGVLKPAAVRYGWTDAPEVNLYNGEGLPAVPFRTDDWPMVTKGRR